MISVCIPTFNGASYLIEAIDSVLKQEHRDFEIVIVDNCSTDETPALVETFLVKHAGRVRYYRNERNLGLAANFNKCLEYARGLYIKFLCVDDLLLPGCLAIMAQALRDHPSATLVCGGRLIINASGDPIELKRYSNKRTVVSGREAIARCVLGTNFIGEPTAVMFRKQDATEVFRADLPQLMDMEMWFRLLEKGDLLSMEQPLCAVRVHDTQMSDVNFKSGHLVFDRIKIFEQYGQHNGLEQSPLRMLGHKLAMTYRVWTSRRFLSNDKKKMVLERYGISIIYPAMPLIFLAFTLKKTLERAVFHWCRPHPTQSSQSA